METTENPLKLNLQDPQAERFERDRKAREEREKNRRRSGMSPPGKLNLPELLETRRHEFLIPDCYFRHSALFGRVFVYQVSDLAQGVEEYQIGDTSLVMTELSKEKHKMSAPSGVIVSAGLEALDWLWSHGVELGSMVKFLHMAPYQMPVGMLGGHEEVVRVLHYTDICGESDLTTRRNEGFVQMDRNHEGIHEYRVNGKILPRPKGLADHRDDY